MAQSMDEQMVESRDQMSQDDEVVEEQDLRKIAPKVARKWKGLAGNLKLTDDDIFPIEADNYGPTGGVKETTLQMLLTWKRKHGNDAKRSVLIAALHDSGLKEVADELKDSNR